MKLPIVESPKYKTKMGILSSFVARFIHYKGLISSNCTYICFQLTDGAALTWRCIQCILADSGGDKRWHYSATPTHPVYYRDQKLLSKENVIWYAKYNRNFSAFCKDMEKRSSGLAPPASLSHIKSRSICIGLGIKNLTGLASPTLLRPTRVPTHIWPL